ncbi:MAG: MBL fold metallo-hydrolase [Clostridiales bacterium]|nr:MBL fold metallo-hydrolase [Clostridiales bacterium]
MKFDSQYFEKEAVSIAEGIYWIGYVDENRKLHCNPYLIIEGDEAVLIDGGNRDDFSNVMLKILRTGLKPSQITRLIYQHYDPDLCGSIPQLEAIINNDNLKIISHADNNVFIHYYSAKTEKLDFCDMDYHFDFSTGRRLEFYPTPYCHESGSFITYDTQTKTLFTSDLFGSYDEHWALFMDLKDFCRECTDISLCTHREINCPVEGIVKFHQKIMTSNRALANSLVVIEKLDIERIAPQHGSIITKKDEVKAIIHHLRAVKNIGIDWLLSEEFK